MMPGHTILVVNPGASSTKTALFHGRTAEFIDVVRHPASELQSFRYSWEQLQYRLDAVLASLRQHGVDRTSVTAVVGRGGLLHPMPSGTYLVNDLMLRHLGPEAENDHPSNLGPRLAVELARLAGVPAYTVDPVSVDELEPVARVTGLPGITRVSASHALNTKAVARRAARELGSTYEQLNLIVAHLGSGVSVSAHRGGRMIDVNNSAEQGPFGVERAGGLPLHAFAAYCLSGVSLAEIKRRLMSQAGMRAHLGTSNAAEVERRIAAGDEEARLIISAMAYNIAKEIGAMAAVLGGKADAIILTGGAAHTATLTTQIADMVGFIAQVIIYPGEDEMLALAEGALRVLSGEDSAREYHG